MKPRSELELLESPSSSSSASSGIPSRRYFLIRVADDVMYFEDCYDYALDIVRKQMYNYIEEILERYDTDGLELDFTRELPCFAIGEEAAGRKIMVTPQDK